MNTADQIDKYLQDEMSLHERNAFEDQMRSDPALADEVQFQKTIVDGIKTYRKSQLKSRLSNIDIPANPFWQGGIAKTAIASLGGAVLVGGIYLYTNKEEAITYVPSGGPVKVKVESFDLPEMPVYDNTEFEGSESAKEILAPVFTTPVTVQEPLEVKEEKKSFQPQISVPSGQEISEERPLDAPEVKPEIAEEASERSEKKLDVTHKDVKNEKLRYKYFDGKLALYGDFSGDPYEVLEIHGASGRSVYLFFAGKYYDLRPTSRPEPLLLVERVEVLRQLEILREEK